MSPNATRKIATIIVAIATKLRMSRVVNQEYKAANGEKVSMDVKEIQIITGR